MLLRRRIADDHVFHALRSEWGLYPSHAARSTASSHCKSIRRIAKPPKQLMDLEFSIVLPEAPKVRSLLAHGALLYERPPCAAKPIFLSLTETVLAFGFSARALFSCT